MLKISKRTIKKLKDPNLLKTGHIKKINKKTYLVVKRNKKGKARYVLANNIDINCDKELKNNIKIMIDKKKKKEIKTYPQAIAIAYSKTSKKYPKCGLIIKNDKTKKQKGGIFGLNANKVDNKIKQYQKNIIKLLITKGYINDYCCNKIKGSNKIIQLNNSKSKFNILYEQYINDFLNKLQNKNLSGFSINNYLKYINLFIERCKINRNVKYNDENYKLVTISSLKTKYNIIITKYNYYSSNTELQNYINLYNFIEKIQNLN